MPIHNTSHMDADYVKKLQDKAIKQAVKDFVLVRRRDGKLQKNAYSSFIDALNKIGVYINRGALYKRVEQEIKNQKPVEIVGYETMMNLSSINEEDYNLAYHFSENSITETSKSNEISSASGHPKGSTNVKKRKDKMNYDACVKSICNDYASELKDCKALKCHCQRKFLDTIIKEKKEE